MAPLVNRDSSTATIQHERPQQRLRELLEQHNRQILPGQGQRVRDPDVLAKSVWQYAKDRDLFQLSLASASKALATRYSSLPQGVLAAWWERKPSVVPRGKENRPPKPPAKRPSAATTLPSSKPNQSLTRAPKDYRVFPEHYDLTPKLSSQPTTVATSKSKLTSCTTAIRRPSSPALPLLSSQSPPSNSHASRKRRKVSSKADAINPSTENASLSPTQEDKLRTHNKLARAMLKEDNNDRQEKQQDNGAVASKRFLWERMNIFYMTEGWERSSTYSGRPLREEGEGRFEYLAKHGFL